MAHRDALQLAAVHRSTARATAGSLKRTHVRSYRVRRPAPTTAREAAREAPDVPSSRLMVVSRSLAARYRPAFCGDGSSANARTASLNAASAAPTDATLIAIRSRQTALAARICHSQGASISRLGAMPTSFRVSPCSANTLFDPRARASLHGRAPSSARSVLRKSERLSRSRRRRSNERRRVGASGPLTARDSRLKGFVPAVHQRGSCRTVLVTRSRMCTRLGRDRAAALRQRRTRARLSARANGRRARSATEASCEPSTGTSYPRYRRIRLTRTGCSNSDHAIPTVAAES